MKLPAWLLLAASLLALSAVLFLAPAYYEGPKLLRLAPGHAVTGMDVVALLPGLAAGVVVLAGLVSPRGPLREAREMPRLGLFVAGLALGLALAARFPYLRVHWPLAAGLLLVAAVLALISVLRR